MDRVEPFAGEKYSISLTQIFAEKLRAGECDESHAECAYGTIWRDGEGPSIDWGNDYFDFWSLPEAGNDMVCADGEECEVIGVDEYGNVTLANYDGLYDTQLMLSDEEFQLAVVGNAY